MGLVNYMNGFVGYGDATLREKIFDIAEAQREPMVQPNGMADDLGWKAMTWIKQHLRIKKFYGASENAVKTQIWIAVSVYVLVAIARKRLGLEASLYQILQILSVTLFEKTPILQALQPSDPHENLLDDPNQLILFDF